MGAGLRAASMQAFRGGLAEFLAPAPDCFAAQRDVAFGQDQFDIAKAQ